MVWALLPSTKNLLNDLSAFSLTLIKCKKGEVSLAHSVHRLVQSTLTGLTLRIELAPAVGGVQVDVLVRCETADWEYEFYRTVNLTESEFPNFLAECLGLFQGLAQVLEQNS